MDHGLIFTIDTSSTVTCLIAANHYLPQHTFNTFLQQTSELDNLTDSLGKVLSLFCAGLRVACNTCVTFPFSYWFDNLSFLLRESCCCASSYLSLGVSNKASHDNRWAPSSSFWRRFRGGQGRLH